MKKNLTIFFMAAFVTYFLPAQTQNEYTSGEIYKKIQKLNFLGTVLYVGAHPDDENTTMISYLSNKENARVAYLAMNRGDGGQNLLGTEIRELLGVIRTEELLAARRTDHAEQFFTRANDFGFSKNPTETFEFWDRDSVLSDVVWIFRKFRPDVVINRFNHRTEGDTHGHHTASAILSTEAFDIAGDKTRFSNQLDRVDPWQPKRLYFNDSWFFYGDKEKYVAADHEGFLEMDLGTYLPILGRSNTEISALSRSQHKSQGFGSAAERGEDLHFFEPIKGDLKGADTSIFAGIDTTWNRIEEGKEIGDILYAIQDNYDFSHPEKSLQELLRAYKKIQGIKDDYWRVLKTRQIKEVIEGVTGLYLEVSTPESNGTLGQEMTLNIEAINRSKANVVLKEVTFKAPIDLRFETDKTLQNDQEFTKETHFKIPESLDYSDPYWLRKPHSLGMYTVNDQDLIGLPETPPQIVARFDLTIDGVPIQFNRELVYKTTTQTQGEVRMPFKVVPELSLKMKDKVLVFPDDKPREVKVEVVAYKDRISGKLKLNQPEEWTLSPREMAVDIDQKGESKTLSFMLTPPSKASNAEITPEFELNAKAFTKKLYTINYPHIPVQTVLLPAFTKVNRVEIKIAGTKIAYIKGAGDEVPEGLREIGYQVTELSGKDLSLEILEPYDAVITGIRAYNTNTDLVLNQKVLFDYVKQGGTLITQYSQIAGIKTEKIGPYPMDLSHDRVTDENSDIHFLTPDHPVLNTPNKITKADFKNWVQERGLYFPHSWSKEYTPILGMQDNGEDELQGSLLVAPYGKGHYVYTGLSFFRQLPAGVPGAYRLFANLLAL